MTVPQTGLERRVQAALDASPSRIPVLLGGCGSGRTALLRRLRERMPRGTVQYVDIERCATTPERFLDAVTASSPLPWRGPGRAPDTARAAFDTLVGYLDGARAPGGEPATFLLDEVLELRTFESFPGLRHVLRDLVQALAASPNRFVLTSRYVARAHRLLRDATARFEVLHVPQLSGADVAALLPGVTARGEATVPVEELEYLGRTVQALTDGRMAYAAAIAEAMAQSQGATDPISALTGLLSPGGVLDGQCHFCYELRLHRARGYGALKAILDILAIEEPLTLTEISQRLHRTPGSTKDYLSWLEDVDLVMARQKRYSFTDPVLRLWVRLRCRPEPPSPDEVGREVQHYALARVPAPEPALAYAGGGPALSADERKNWGIIEID
jgi:hypothetical protein